MTEGAALRAAALQAVDQGSKPSNASDSSFYSAGMLALAFTGHDLPPPVNASLCGLR